mgnify:CR=1 FL=1
MGETMIAIEQALRLNVDENASVQRMSVKLSAYLSSAYDLFKAKVLESDLVLAMPADAKADPAKTVKGMAMLSKSLNMDATACFSSLSRPQRRELIKLGRPFMTIEGDFYLPQLSFSLTKKSAVPLEVRRSFNPAQQLVFLYCLYSGMAPISQTDVKQRTGLSSGSVSSALSMFVELGLLECSVGGKTGRRKSYLISDVARFYRDGIDAFGSPVRETAIVPASAVRDDWPTSGLSALAEQSDLLPPTEPSYAISPAQAKLLPTVQDDSLERCTLHVLRFDPSVFAKDDRVDPLTMLLTIDEEDERISIALQQALGGYAWYQG